MRISVIIPAYRAAATLLRAVESLLETRYPSLEILIVVDGAVDETESIALGLADTYPNHVVVYTHAGRARKGVSATRNLGIQKCAGELICFLDADDIVLPNRYEEAVSLLRADSALDGVYGSTRVEPDPNGPPGDWQAASMMGLPAQAHPEDVLDHLLSGALWHTSGILCRAGFFQVCGLFDEDLAVAEDCHLWFRMACAGRLAGLDCDQPVSVYYRRAGTAFQPGLERKLDMMIAMTRFVTWMKHHSVDVAKRRSATQKVETYGIAAMSLARENGSVDLARRLGLCVLRAMPGIARRRDFRVQMVCTMLGR